MNVYETFQLPVTDKAAKAREDFKRLIELASQNKISWEVLFSYLENWTPTIEMSKQVIRMLLRDLQTFQSKLQQKNINGGFKNEPSEHNLGELKTREYNQAVDSKSHTTFIGNMKELPENTDKKQIIIKQELPVENPPISNDTKTLQSFDVKATIKSENQNVLEETKHIYLPANVNDNLPAGASYECLTCLAKFPSFTILQNHLKMHAKERPFVCRFCQKRFKHSTHLKEHEFIHSGKTPYRCTTCGKCFAKSSDLKKHENIILKKNHFSVKNAPKGSL